MLAAWLLVDALFIYFSHTYAIEQSYDKFTQNLGNIKLMTDFVVVEVVEALGGLLLAIFMMRNYFGEPVKKFFRFAIYIPGVLVFPALFYFSSFAYLNFTGVNFKLMAIILAVTFPAVLFGIHVLLKWLIPEFDIRTELKFIVHILQLIGGIILSIQYLKLPVHTVQNSQVLNTKELLLIVFSAIIIIMLGVVKYQFVMWRKIKK